MLERFRATSIWNDAERPANGSEEILEFPGVLVGGCALDSPLLLLQEPGIGATHQTRADTKNRTLSICVSGIPYEIEFCTENQH